MIRAEVARQRVFFALQPEVAAAREARGLAERLRLARGLKGRPITAERFHVSLHSLGDAPSDQTISKACEAVSAVAQRSFLVALNRVATFGGGALVLYGDEGVIGIDLLHKALHSALVASGVTRGPPRAFEPHMTLLWDPREAAEQVLLEPIGWRAREFVLLRSLNGEGRHEVLARWSLA
jgi:2'-5' RNA ligase